MEKSTVAWLFVPDLSIWFKYFLKQQISWDFDVKQSLEFTSNNNKQQQLQRQLWGQLYLHETSLRRMARLGAQVGYGNSKNHSLQPGYTKKASENFLELEEKKNFFYMFH